MRDKRRRRTRGNDRPPASWVRGRGRASGVGLVRLRAVFRGAAEDLDDHPEVTIRSEVRDPGAAELTTENHAVPAVGLRNGLVELRSGDGDMVDTLVLLGEETRVDAQARASARS